MTGDTVSLAIKHDEELVGCETCQAKGTILQFLGGHCGGGYSCDCENCCRCCSGQCTHMPESVVCSVCKGAKLVPLSEELLYILAWSSGAISLKEEKAGKRYRITADRPLELVF